MKKLKYVEVVCIPSVGNWMSSKGDNGLRKDAIELINQIKRHCDHFSDLSPRPFWQCEFCENEWEETYDTEHKVMLPACCSKAVDQVLESIAKDEAK